MRHALAVLFLIAVPTSAFAAEPLAVHAAPASAESEVEFQHRPQVMLSLDINDAGFGARAGVHFRWVELSGGLDSFVFNLRESITLKVIPFPDDVMTPYVYGRLGRWTELGLFGERDQTGDDHAGGVGLELHMSRQAFLFTEMGLARRTGASRSDLDTQGLEARLGVGVRF